MAPAKVMAGWTPVPRDAGPLPSPGVAATRINAMISTLLGRLLCLLGIHDFEILEVSAGFGIGGSVAKVRCKRCGIITTRRN